MEDLPTEPLTDGHQSNDPPYEVGYGRPPEATKFRPGQSGNPSGRPKGSKNLATLVLKHLQTKVTVRENGRERRMSKLDVGLTKMMNRFAEKGELNLFNDLRKLFDRPEAQTIVIQLPVDVTRLTMKQLLRAFDENWDRVEYRTMLARQEMASADTGKPASKEPPSSDTLH